MFDDYDYQGFKLGDEVAVRGYQKIFSGKIVGIFEPFYGSSNHLFCVDIGEVLTEKVPDLPRVIVGAPSLWDLVSSKKVAFCFASSQHFHRMVALTPRLTFSQVIEFEAKHPGLYYKRVDDGDWKWCLRFAAHRAGLLQQFTFDRGIPSSSVEIYHHDLADGLFMAYTDFECRRPFRLPKETV